MEIDIIYEDAAIAVVDKPAGVIVHRAPGHDGKSLADALARRFPQMARVGSAERPGVVHRLDLETSGVMAFAKTQRAYIDLRRQFESHETVEKTYLAVVHGRPRTKTGTIDTPVGHQLMKLKYQRHVLILNYQIIPLLYILYHQYLRLLLVHLLI